MASPDAVALDAVAAGVIGYGPGVIDTTRIAEARELGVGNLAQLDWQGPPLDQIAVRDYKLPSNSLLRLVPGWLAKFAGRFVWVRPRAVADNCEACGICIDNCPVGCMVPDANGVPIIDYTTCINCLSCDESCAHEAIIQQMSWLARKLQ
jgi:Pyruvate/2-oxoacid:ferredoxin oxidoreductase delta subunit